MSPGMLELVYEAMRDHGLDTEAFDELETDAQALADVRTLDDWVNSDVFNRWSSRRGTLAPSLCQLFYVRDDHNHCKQFFAPTPDEARAKAAAWVRERSK